MKEARRYYSTAPTDEGYASGTSHNATLDGAFRNVQKNSTAFLIWRIENMNVVPLPKDQYGTFNTNDCYIIYAASQSGVWTGTDAVSREIRSGALEYHIHFWLGSSTSPEKSGVTAYKTVELDGHIGGTSTQHRETQGNESARFKSYFKNGFRVLKEESNSSGLNNNHVKSLECKIFKVKGRTSPITMQEENASWKSFNSGYVFLIVTPNTIFVWIGRAATGLEKLHATKAAITLKAENNVANIIFVDDGYEKTLNEDAKREFNKYLPLETRTVYSPDQGGEDEVLEKHGTHLKLYRCSDNSGKYRVAEIKSAPIVQVDLYCEEVYILDNAVNGIWIWVGKKASDKERTEALRNARGFLKKKCYPNNTKVTRVVDGSEPVEFKMLFVNWKNKDEIKYVGKIKPGNVSVTKFDAQTMQERPTLSAESQLIDDGSGNIKIWKITRSNAVEILQNHRGIFFTAESYIILYTYRTNKENNIIYYWTGSEVATEEAAWVSQEASEMNKELCGKTVQVRVTQGLEPPHFLQLFKGQMIIFRGKSTDFEAQGRNSKGPMHYLLQIFGSSTYTAKAIHVHCKAASLNSNYCFVLKRHKRYFIWCGSYSTGDQREMAKGFVGKDFEILMEGKETVEFWSDLGDKTTYATAKNHDETGNYRPARLFQCSNITGSFKAEEIMNFTQSDLLPEDVMLLDIHNKIFVWLGDLCTKEEEVKALGTAQKYLQNDPAIRNVNIPIAIIKQGYEPPTFIGFFATWNAGFWEAHKSFEQLRNDIDGATTPVKIRNGVGNSESSDHFDRHVKYPIGLLTGPIDALPNKVDTLKKELHLTHDDFVSLFNINYAEFENLPKWKQQEMKKKVGLF